MMAKRARTKREDEDTGTGAEAPAGEKARIVAPDAEDGSTAAAESTKAAEGQTDADALRDRLLRLQADFDNYRKRTLRERESERVRANEDLVLGLLPILDHLELGIESAVKHAVDASVVQGFRLVYDQAVGALHKFGMEPIEAENQPFDPNHHESVAVMPSDTVPRDHVVAQVRRGYRLGAQLLRASQVVLSAGPAGVDGEPDSDGGKAE